MGTKLSEQLKMKRAKREGLVNTSTETPEETGKTEVRVPAADIVNSYDFNLLKKLPYREIEPNRCRPWDHHNRSTLWLTPEKARSLTDSIRSIGQQELGLVRELENDPDYDYEIIYGVRRWYACSLIPNQKFKAKVTKENDTYCAKLMHFENEESKDISDIEKAMAYHHQITHKLFSTQKNLAKELQISEALLTRYLKGAKLFDNLVLKELLTPYLLEITIKSASDLYEFTRQDDTKSAILRKAEALLNDENSLLDMTGKSIIQSLKRAAENAKIKSNKLKSNYHQPYKVNKLPNGDLKLILNSAINDFNDQEKLHSLVTDIVNSICKTTQSEFTGVNSD